MDNKIILFGWWSSSSFVELFTNAPLFARVKIRVNFQYDYLKRPTTINILKVYTLFFHLAFFDLRALLIINTKYAYTIHVKSVRLSTS